MGDLSEGNRIFPRVVLADDKRLMRTALAHLIDHLAIADVVGEAGDGTETLRVVTVQRPDVVLLDAMLPGSVDLVRRITKVLPRTRVLILTGGTDTAVARQALLVGAKGCVTKTADVNELVAAFAHAMDGHCWISPPIAAALLDRSVSSDGDPSAVLTLRQREVLQLLAEGTSAHGIAEILGISVKTVETHRTNLMKRLRIDNLAGLIRFALRTGLTSL